jgi:hypothetical protein
MMKILAAALVVTGAAWLTTTAPANAAPRIDGIQTTTQTDLSAHRRSYRHTHRRVVRYYTAPRYYGYYGPTYYERPYYRPAPLFFGLGGFW